MTTQGWDDDDAILREVATALREVEHVAGPVRAAGEAAYTWRGIDEELELASLAYDSLLDVGPAVRATAVDGGRTLLFTGPSASVQVEHDSGMVVGQLIPPGPGRLTVEGGDGYRAEWEVDEVGCFSFRPPAAEPVRLRVRADSVELVTDWISF
ncbi:hypothetical protein [Jidongwangia harbinensis]|uniref:hypothetical protein n=1 Tax=Jidongwangia harbinensis TaxID=2878561 RepID=UPI001CD9C225|nr:hypothetical protein [Jidongwangia harbinensis]MCA2211380.1 hypothetical protein [Jidongwangia harbinensis]